MQRLTLVRHSATPSSAVRGIDVCVECVPAGGQNILKLTYVIEGDLSEVRIPAPRPPQLVHELWKHTCCEVFIGAAATPAYSEFNFSPSGEWARYDFQDYRHKVADTAGQIQSQAGAPATTTGFTGFTGVPSGRETTLAGTTAPQIVVRPGSQRFELEARIAVQADTLPLHENSAAGHPVPNSVTHAAARKLKLALAVVVEDKHGALSYWALHHPSAKPDFHHAEGFVLELALDETTVSLSQNLPNATHRVDAVTAAATATAAVATEARENNL